MRQENFNTINEVICESIPTPNAKITVISKSGQRFHTSYRGWQDYNTSKHPSDELIFDFRHLRHRKGQLHIEVEDIEAIII